MINVVGIRFQQDGKMIYYDAGEIELHAGDYVVAESGRSIELGEVVLGVHEMEEDQVKSPLPKIVRAATDRDIQQATDNRTKERDAYYIAQKKIAEHGLEMKLVSVESTFDNSKMMFYFTANGRVDFRALVKDLASTFRTRIELRQIGVRDEARMLGGLGPCGRPICCGAFLSDFQPVSIKMAKEQSLSLNPTKISGVCGRLMCCLKYEQDQYEATRKRMPRVGREVVTPDGNGTVTDLNIVKETVSVRIPVGDSTEIREYPLEKISRPGAQNAPAQQEDAALQDSDVTEEEKRLEAELEDGELQRAEADHSEENTAQRKPRKPKNNTGNSNPRFGPRPKKEGESRNRDENAEEEKKNGNRPPRKNLRAKNPQFGQPVRRENPDRDKKPNAQPAAAAAEKRENVPMEKSEAVKQPEKPTKSKEWADAVEKALQTVEPS